MKSMRQLKIMAVELKIMQANIKIILVHACIVNVYLQQVHSFDNNVAKKVKKNNPIQRLNIKPKLMCNYF